MKDLASSWTGLSGLSQLAALAVAIFFVQFLPLATAVWILSLTDPIQAKETFPTVARSAVLVLTVTGLLQGVSIAMASRREVSRPWRRYLALVSTTGWSFLGWALFLLAFTLWAAQDFLAITTVGGVMTAFALVVFYLFLTLSALLSARRPLGKAGSRGMASRGVASRSVNSRGTAAGRFTPSSITVGDSAEYRLSLGPERALPLWASPFYRLVVKGSPISGGSGGKNRWELSRGLRGVFVRTSLHRTSRGVFRADGANLFYEDFFGLTRVAVVRPPAPAVLRVLPRQLPCRRLSRSPRRSQATGPLSRLDRQGDQDWFRFREYRRGDDTRRIHWQLSLRHGQLILRQPESREASSSLALVLDTYHSVGSLEPPRKHLDSLVEAWLAVAGALRTRGVRVELHAPFSVDGGEPSYRKIESGVDLARARSLGAELDWQSQVDLDLCPALAFRGGAIVVSGRLDPWPSLGSVGAASHWLFKPFSFQEPVESKKGRLLPVLAASLRRGLESKGGFLGLVRRGRWAFRRRQRRDQWRRLAGENAQRLVELRAFASSVELVEQSPQGFVLTVSSERPVS